MKWLFLIVAYEAVALIYGTARGFASETKLVSMDIQGWFLMGGAFLAMFGYTAAVSPAVLLQVRSEKRQASALAAVLAGICLGVVIWLLLSIGKSTPL